MLFDLTQVGLFAAAVLPAGRTVIQRVGAAFFVTCGFVLAWYAPGMPLARALCGFLAGASLMLVVKIAFSSKERQSRVKQLCALPGPMRPVRVPATLSPRVAGLVMLDLVLAGMALLVLLRTCHLSGIMPRIARLGAGVLLAYAGVQCVFDFAQFCFLAAGWSLNSLHRTPIASRSVAEFWSRRWNRIVSAGLHEFVFLPLARRHFPRLGVFCAFFVSGLLHAWPILVAVGCYGAFTTFLFFTLQGVFVLAEHKLRVNAWPAPIARGWTVGVLLVSSPLFIDPGLRVFGL